MVVESNMRYRFFIVVGLIATVSICFYWFELRPAKIRSDCSRVKHHQDAVPERSIKTEKELLDLGIIEDCSAIQNMLSKPSSTLSDQYLAYLQKKEEQIPCRERNKGIIEDYKTLIPATPAKDWFSPAKEATYVFCLRDHGITH